MNVSLLTQIIHLYLFAQELNHIALFLGHVFEIDLIQSCGLTILSIMKQLYDLYTISMFPLFGALQEN